MLKRLKIGKEIIQKEVDNLKFGVIEIGSTNTKTYIYDNNKFMNGGFKYIAFKDHYNEFHQLLDSDIETLYELIGNLKKETDKIYAFGTSIFRKLSNQEKEEFTKKLKQDWDIDFKVVSADEESTYTVHGVIDNIDYKEKMAVIIGGGGSTEIAIVENKQIVEKINLDFGAMDVTNKFPELKSDIVKSPYETFFEYVSSLIEDFDAKVDTVVLAGGDYIYFYEHLNYPMDKNSLYSDSNQPYMLKIEKSDQYDLDVMHKSLDKIKENAADPGWWDGARGMRFCISAVAHKLNAKIIIPTRINMLIGIINEIVSNNSKME